MTDDERQGIVDGEHIRVLSVCYYVYAGFNAFSSLFGLFYAFMGLMIGGVVFGLPAAPNQPRPPASLAALFGVFGFGIFLFFIGLAILKFMAAVRLRRRRSRVFCMIVGALTCLGIPFGTALGVFTLVVLSRKSVPRLFDTQAPDATGA
jgi:uncharacterized membrane protein HdeD (DUF308 family)